ncbi:MAG: helix-turn-helix domain-containing protein [Desulfobacteraceae bacterium]|jgi:excisionase family DNA binding protein|nr:helix-turn-helix domain-containing protein [Desulfobacteraceae bacterium]
MLPNRKLQHRQDDDRRRKPDRRNGSDRRSDGVPAAAEDDAILNTKEACDYLKISRPTFLKYIAAGKIKAQKIGNGWKVFKADLDRIVRGEQ